MRYGIRSCANWRRELHERLLLRNEQTKQVQLPDVYMSTDASRKNVSAWMNAQYIHDAAPNILPVSCAASFLSDARSLGAA